MLSRKPGNAASILPCSMALAARDDNLFHVMIQASIHDPRPGLECTNPRAQRGQTAIAFRILPRVRYTRTNNPQEDRSSKHA